MNDIELQFSIDKLIASGLLARKSDGAIAGIIGGTGSCEKSAIILYEDAFSIYLELNGKWVVRYPGLGQLVHEVACESLDEAVSVLLKKYVLGKR